MTASTPCAHDGTPVAPNGQPVVCGACNAVLVPVTYPTTVTVYVDRPAPMTPVRCDDATGHAEHPWNAPIGSRGDLAPAWCTGDPDPTDEKGPTS